MKSVLTKLLAAAVGMAPFVALTGCSYEGHARAYPAHDDVYVYHPGYYYDNEYYDPAGHYHARRYYYYDGHRWADRDGVPSGFTAQARHERHERHEEHREHNEHHDHDSD